MFSKHKHLYNLSITTTFEDFVSNVIIHFFKLKRVAQTCGQPKIHIFLLPVVGFISLICLMSFAKGLLLNIMFHKMELLFFKMPKCLFKKNNFNSNVSFQNS